MNERELKYSTTASESPDEAELSAVLSRAGFELGQGRTVEQKDRYFDDARLSLSRAGLSLRRRMVEGEMLATLKTRGHSAGALHDREEIELPLSGQDWPKPILDRVATVTAPGLLEPNTVLETRRTAFAVLQGGRPVAKLSFDEVTGRPQSGQRTVEFNEVEIEAYGRTDSETLERIASAVAEIVPLVENSSTKLERVRQLLLLGEW